MAVQKRIAQVSLAKQSAKGSAATSGVYQIGVQGGAVAGAVADDAEIPMTWSGRDVEGFDRVSLIPELAFDVVAMPKTIGALLFAACGSDTVTGSSDPYSHAIATGADLPYWTIFSTHGTEHYKFTDAKLNTLELDWNAAGAVTAKTSWMACGISFPASYTAGTDERPGGGLLKGAGGLFQIDGVDAVVKQGSVKIDNKLAAVLGSAAVTPADVFPGEHTLTVSLTIVPDDLTSFRKMVTGDVAGTSAAVVPYVGTMETKFVVPGTTGSHYLDLLVNAAKMAIAFPAADPNGGAQEVVVEAIAQVVAADGSAPYGFTLQNDVTSY